MGDSKKYYRVENVTTVGRDLSSLGKYSAFSWVSTVTLFIPIRLDPSINDDLTEKIDLQGSKVSSCCDLCVELSQLVLQC